MSLDAQVLHGVDLTDLLQRRPVLDTELIFEGKVWDVRRDTIDLGEAGTVRREYVEHPGAVSAVALRRPRPHRGAPRTHAEPCRLLRGRWCPAGRPRPCPRR